MNADPARPVRLVSVGAQLLRIHVRSGDPRRTPLLLSTASGRASSPSTRWSTRSTPTAR